MLGAVSFGTGAIQSEHRVALFRPGAALFGSGAVPSRLGAALFVPGISFGPEAALSGPGAVSFGSGGATFEIGALNIGVDVAGPKLGVSGAGSVHSD